jgi:Protein of unknown function, DUF488
VAVVLTVGHGTRPAEALLTVPQHAGGDHADRHPKVPRLAPPSTVRACAGGEPARRRHPVRVAGRGPGWPAIPACIVPAGALVDAAFGGYADHMDTPAFRRAVQALVGRAEADERLAVMCAETLWWRCHRSLVADALMCRGVDVAHLIDVGRREPHRVRPTMRCGDDGWPVYDVPDTLPLRTKGGEEDRADGIAYERRHPR